MYKANASILDWAIILTKISYIMLLFFAIKIFVVIRNIFLSTQKLIFLKNNEQIQNDIKKSTLEQHIWQELYLTKSIAHKRDR